MKAINYNKRPVKTHKATNSTTASVIDYIFLKERDTGLVHSSAVGIAKNTDIRSDHRPIMLRLKWMKCLKPKKYIEKKLKPNEIQWRLPKLNDTENGLPSKTQENKIIKLLETFSALKF